MPIRFSNACLVEAVGLRSRSVTDVSRTKKRGGQGPPRLEILLTTILDDVDFSWQIRSHFEANFGFANGWLGPGLHNVLSCNLVWRGSWPALNV
jgi:hypothetical protein